MVKGQRSKPDDRGVTPVIGIILLVAIAVILASTIGMLAFGLFDQKTNPAPQVSFTYNYDKSNSELTITHESGDRFQRANIHLAKEGQGEISNDITDDWPTEVNAGDTIIVTNVASDDKIRIVWEDPRNKDMTAVIGVWKGPDAE